MNKSNAESTMQDESFLKSERLPRICGHMLWFPLRFQSHLADDLVFIKREYESSLNCIPQKYLFLFYTQLRCNHNSEWKTICNHHPIIIIINNANKICMPQEFGKNLHI